MYTYREKLYNTFNSLLVWDHIDVPLPPVFQSWKYTEGLEYNTMAVVLRENNGGEQNDKKNVDMLIEELM